MRSSDKSDCWILNTAFTVDEFSFVESLTVSCWTVQSSHNCQL